MANIIAVVAVLEIHAEINAVTAPKANKIRDGREPMIFSDSTPNAKRLSKSCRKIARAKMKEPINKNISGSANGAKTVRASATLRRTHKAAPSKAVTGIGKLSQIHKIMTTEITAAKL